MSTRREFLITSAAAAAPPRQPPPKRAALSPAPTLDGFNIARRCSIVRTLPTPGFFEGMLLGNGDIGVCVTTRPDALVFHIGKSDSWDIRVSEHAGEILTFAKLQELWERASAEAKRANRPGMLFLERDVPFFREYTDKVTASYSKLWPRPWPCGIVYVEWDASRVQIVRQTLDLSRGHYILELNDNGRPLRIDAFVNTTTGHLCVWSDSPAAIQSVTYYPNIDPKAELPAPDIAGRARAASATFSGYQQFPAIAPTDAVPHPPASPKDRNFALHCIVQGAWTVVPNTTTDEHPNVSLRSAKRQLLRFDLALFTPRDHAENVTFAVEEASRLSQTSIAELQSASDRFWQDFWSRSAVEIKDEELQRLWYQNQYWLACCLRQGKLAPGLFGNWTSGSIGTAWHGDYHMNYNTQQVFWGVFSSNHADQHLPYVELVESLLPMSQRYAQEKFGLPGAYFPHSAYPVPSEVVPYPAPPWGYEICETPWVVQSLWWHYLYTQNKDILQRVYPLLKAAAQFIAAYVKRAEDGKYHVSPTVSPENWGFTVDYRLNRDCIMDLALIDFLLQAVVTASELLISDADDRKLWQDIRSNLAPYPHAATAAGEVWVDVANAPPGWIYNIPVTLAPVFPGERVGLGSSEAELKIARQTANTIRLEGGNDLVYQPLILARLASLDLEWFKQQVRYCQLPNGIANDRVRQAGGRYTDATDFDFMMRMGVWTENFSLPAVLNECMLQSYSGTIRLFPNTQNLGPARFRNLRAVGAFLISAEWDGKTVSGLELFSESGGNARVLNPWGAKAKVAVTPGQKPVPVRQGDSVLEFATRPGERYLIEKGK